jgi:hypothetical protein
MKRRYVGRLVLSVVLGLVSTGCSSNSLGGNPNMTDNDVIACDDYSYLENPYDGSTESLFDYEAFDDFYYEVDDAFWSADDYDLIYYSDSLKSEINDVLQALDNGYSKSEIEAEAEEIDWYAQDLLNYCNNNVFN